MIGVAILGTGSIARVHLEGFRKYPGSCEIRAFCDLNRDKAEQLARESELNDAFCSDDYRETIERPDIDLVSICLPPSLHRETAVHALEAGRHALLEKPMASSVAECDLILDAVKRSGKKLSVISQNRFQTTMMRLKKLLDSGVAGRVLHGMVHSFWWRGQSYYDLSWRGTWEKEGGGCTLNHAVHHVDLLLWMLGMPDSVTSFITNLNHHNSETEDFSTSLLRYREGTIAQLTASLVHHGEEQEMVFQCERGRVSFPWKIHASRALENGFPEHDAQAEAEIQKAFESLAPLPLEGHAAQIGDLLSAIEKGSEPLVDGVAARRTLELITGIYKSFQTETTVTFPLDPTDPFCRAETLVAKMPRFHEKTRSRESFSTTSISLGRQG
ncbi:MAG: gfo/Idh/MocA family oxidoreductase [Spirochaetaceae bacterium]|nr:MAG: gfo/Idh/MocA family oxidoreductase [Spirochaetaceae bacterium]